MYLFYSIWGIWFLSEILFSRLFHSDSSDNKNKDRGSVRLLWIAVGIAILSGVFCGIFVSVPIGKTGLIPHIGLLIIVLGMVFRFIAIRSLGRLFTVDVTIRKNHYVKKDGMYRYIRHPSYTGMLICFIGFGMSENNWVSLLIITVIISSALIYRINIEETVLIEQFANEYSDYIKNTWRMIPWIF
jgi:protein-S-isoprenylcysteine O-methyltransferase Ste14